MSSRRGKGGDKGSHGEVPVPETKAGKQATANSDSKKSPKAAVGKPRSPKGESRLETLVSQPFEQPGGCCAKLKCILATGLVLLLVLVGILTVVMYPHIFGQPSWYPEHCEAALEAPFDPQLEADVTAAVTNLMQSMSQDHPFNPSRRGQHARSIACLRGTFEVFSNISSEYKHGIFATPKAYKAWVRISPGQSDIEPDTNLHARGFSIKLAGVPGQKLIDDEKTTQDFLLINSPVFFTGDNHDYVRLIPNIDHPLAMLDLKASTYKMLMLAAYVANLRSWTSNPLTHNFWSTTPYMLGNDIAVKYAVQPCGNIDVKYTSGPSQMRDAIRATLDPASGQDVCYDFFAQKRVNPCLEYTEDPTIPWNTELVKVARLTFPKQNFMYEDQFAFCERLSFNPWHTTAAHRPLGSINHVRKLVYNASLAFRTSRANYTHLAELTGDETFHVAQKDLSFDLNALREAQGDVAGYKYARYAMDGTDLSAVPAHVVGVPKGEAFDATTFMMLAMRMFIGDYAGKRGEHATAVPSTKGDDVFEVIEDKARLFAFRAGAVLADKVQEFGLIKRLKERTSTTAAEEAATDLKTAFQNEIEAAQQQIFPEVHTFFSKLVARANQMGFGNAIDAITTVFKKTSSADLSEFKDPQDYEQLFARSWKTAMPWVVEGGKWRHDDTFGAQYLRGVNPTSIRRAHGSVPSGINLNSERTEKVNEVIKRVRPSSNDDLASLLKRGQLFYAEYSVLHGLNRVPDAHLDEPTILFALTDHKEPNQRQLMPLAVQIADGRIFYPPSTDCNDVKHHLDSECVQWLFVKMHVASADANYHEASVHLGMTHLLLEPLLVAAHRQFNKSHPIFLALLPHFHQTIAINDEGRESLISPTGIFEKTTALGIKGTLQLINRSYQQLNFTNWAFPRRMESYGFPYVPAEKRLTDSDDLPGYLYRDFAYDLWNAYREYFGRIVDKTYPNDKALLSDFQVQGYAYDVSSPNLANIPTFPSKFETKAVLADTMTTIAFSASIQHSAVNFGQFDGYGFVPNRPLTLTKPIPSNLKDLTMPYVMSTLPQTDRSFGQMAVTFALSTPPGITGSTYPLEWAFKNSNSLSPDPAAFSALIQRFKQLKDQFHEVTEKNHWHYYTYLRPDLLAVSIAI